MRFTCDRVLAMILVSGSLAAGCNGSLASPTAPTPTPVAPSPSPSPGMFTLSGRVTETPPTTQTGIGGATVRVTSAPGADKSAITNSMGFYSIPDVAPGSAIRVSANGYVETTIDSGHGASDFQLMPVPQTTQTTLTDTLSAQVGTCNDGVSMKPCHIVTIPIHNSGPFDATLTWTPADQADLDLSLFRTGTSSFISRSASRGAGPERISVDLSDGANYELRITYASGTGTPKYTLRATHQN